MYVPFLKGSVAGGSFVQVRAPRDRFRRRTACSQTPGVDDRRRAARPGWVGRPHLDAVVPCLSAVDRFLPAFVAACRGVAGAAT